MWSASPNGRVLSDRLTTENTWVKRSAKVSRRADSQKRARKRRAEIASAAPGSSDTQLLPDSAGAREEKACQSGVATHRPLMKEWLSSPIARTRHAGTADVAATGFRIDLHVHCAELSPCGRSSAEEMIEAAIRNGLEALVFTNHGKLVPERQLDFWNQRYAPFHVFNGIEVHADGDDFLVLGVLDTNIEKHPWRYAALYDFVREQGGFFILAHPYRYREVFDVDLARLCPDAIECCSTNIPPANTPRILALAEKLAVPVVCASDAHCFEHVGLWHVELARPVADERELAAALHSGHFTCVLPDTAPAPMAE